MILYVDGDSYTAPELFVGRGESYWFNFGKYLQAGSITNYAYLGKSNEAMIRNTVRFCLDHPDQDLFVLVGLSHLERRDSFEPSQHHYSKSTNPNPMEAGVVSKPLHQNADLVKFYDRELEESLFLSDLITFYWFLETRKNVKFMLHFCSSPLNPNDRIPLLSSFYKEAQKCHKIVNLFDNTYRSINENLGIKPVDFDDYGWFGHHGIEGNKVYGDFLIKKYQELYEN